MKTLLFYVIILAGISCSQQPKDTPVSTTLDFSTIAIGSCARQDLPEHLWKEVTNSDPDLWIWLGDNVYADTEDMRKMASDYDKQKSHPDYQKLIASAEVIGIWDDHDFGVNDGGKEYSKKDSSKILLMDFLDVSPENDVWNHKGIYQTYQYGEGEKTVKVFLLDTRYFRDSLFVDYTEGKKYVPNPNGDVLGEEQWQWLEKELAASTATVNIIASSIQVIPDEHKYEKWANLPKSQKRLFKLISEIQPSNPFIISGDRHISEFMKIDIDGMTNPIYEFTSSGLTHTWSSGGSESNRFRVGNMQIAKSFGIIQFDWVKKNMELKMMGKNDTVYQSLSIPIH